MTRQPMNYDINVQPIFVKEGVEYPFEGLSEDERGEGCIYLWAPIEYKFIVNTLRFVFGDVLDFKAGYKNGTLVIARLSNDQLQILKDIREDTCDVPVKYGQSCLRFEIGTHRRGFAADDVHPCDCECRWCCGR